jgi:hypothetical protein
MHTCREVYFLYLLGYKCSINSTTTYAKLKHSVQLKVCLQRHVVVWTKLIPLFHLHKIFHITCLLPTVHDTLLR